MPGINTHTHTIASRNQMAQLCAQPCGDGLNSVCYIHVQQTHDLSLRFTWDKKRQRDAVLG